jgi:hypothetical protein
LELPPTFTAIDYGLSPPPPDEIVYVERPLLVFDDPEFSFEPRYSDYFWAAVLVLFGLGSAGAWFRHYLKRDERELRPVSLRIAVGPPGSPLARAVASRASEVILLSRGPTAMNAPLEAIYLSIKFSSPSVAALHAPAEMPHRTLFGSPVS